MPTPTTAALAEMLATIPEPHNVGADAHDPADRFCAAVAAIRDAEKVLAEMKSVLEAAQPEPDKVRRTETGEREDLEARRLLIEANYRFDLLRVEQTAAARALVDSGLTYREAAELLETRVGMVVSRQRIHQITKGVGAPTRKKP